MTDVRLLISQIRRDPKRTVEFCSVLNVRWDGSDTPVEEITLPAVREEQAGRSLGNRGIAFYKDKIYLASSASKIFVLHKDTYSLLDTIEFPPGKVEQLHQIKTKDGLLWILSTGTDQIHKFDGRDIVETVNLEDFKEYIDPAFERSTADFTHKDVPWGRDRLHFNSIGWSPSGLEYHVYAGAHCVFDFTNKRIVLEFPDVDQPHDVVFLDDNRVLINGSIERKTKLFNISKGTLEVIHEEPDKNNEHSDYSQWGFARGLAYLPERNLIFATYSPCILQVYDSRDFRVLDRAVLSSDPQDSPYDILIQEG